MNNDCLTWKACGNQRDHEERKGFDTGHRVWPMLNKGLVKTEKTWTTDQKAESQNSAKSDSRITFLKKNTIRL